MLLAGGTRTAALASDSAAARPIGPSDRRCSCLGEVLTVNCNSWKAA
jgi:hypothetical protein